MSVLDYTRTLPGRCSDCGWHIEKQGHSSTCDIPQRLGQEGMVRVTGNHPTDAARVDAVLETFIRSGLEFSLNDMRPHLADVKARNVIGARINAAARAKRIKRIGYEPSTQPETHGHPIARWRAT